MRRRFVPTVLGVVVALALAAGCSSQDVTKPALEGDIATVYSHLLVKRDRLLHQPTPHDLRVGANCYRGGPAQPDVGPGKDWRCDLTADAAGQDRAKVSYLVNARTNGCWTALVESLAANADAVDVATMTDPRTGKTLTDPTGGFDGCLRA